MQNFTKRENIEFVIVAVSFLIAFIIMFAFFPAPKGKYYDCGMAEWHPDIPTKVKDECRKIRAENFKEDLQKPK